MSLAKNWCFTINNPTDNDKDLLYKLSEAPSCRYLVFQQEIAPTTGTPHIQGFVSLNTRKRLSGLKKLVGDRAHLEVARGTAQQNRDYCSKSESAIPETFEEFGEIPEEKRGQRSDLDEFKTAVKEGCRDRKRLREEYSDIYAKYPRFCEAYISDCAPEISVPNHDLRDWQRDLNEQLSHEPDDRTITFVVDTQGGKGKTWFAKWYCKKHSDAQYMEPAKKADMAYSLDDNIRVLFLNVTRTQTEKSEYLYAFVESVKDGLIFSPKYESRMKQIGKCHVVVMMNQEPLAHLLSADRLDVKMI